MLVEMPLPIWAILKKVKKEAKAPERPFMTLDEMCERYRLQPESIIVAGLTPGNGELDTGFVSLDLYLLALDHFPPRDREPPSCATHLAYARVPRPCVNDVLEPFEAYFAHGVRMYGLD
jgi:hypothetical protein